MPLQEKRCIFVAEMIDQATIDRILDAAQIVDVVSEFVTLKRAGVNYKGLCPFHNEKTPSFVVSPSKGLCKCFSCGKGGNVVHFIMEHEQLNYYEALKWLANKYHIEVKERELSAEEKQVQNDGEEHGKEHHHFAVCAIKVKLLTSLRNCTTCI